MRTRPQDQKPDPASRRKALGFPIRPPPPPMERTVFHDHVSLWGWPSRGGLIVLERATGVDMDFLGFYPVKPPLQRDPDQDAEDRFCQQLLRLGAKWFDSRQRFSFISGILGEDDAMVSDLENGIKPGPAPMERCWVCVGILAGSAGGLWVAEYEQPMYGTLDNLEPGDTARVLLARTMEERCEILKAMGATFYKSEREYQGVVCLRAWEEKITGEVGPLVPTRYCNT